MRAIAFRRPLLNKPILDAMWTRSGCAHPQSALIAVQKITVMRQLCAGVSAEFGRPSADFTTKCVGPRSSIEHGDSYSLALSSASARTISIPTASRSQAASAALETTLRGVWFILLRENGQSYGVEEADDRKSEEGIPPVIRDS
jgi:hypothetical protein